MNDKGNIIYQYNKIMFLISGFYQNTQKYVCDINLTNEQSMYLHHYPMDINILYNLNKWNFTISNRKQNGKSFLVGYTETNTNTKTKISVYLNIKGELEQNNKVIKLYPNYSIFNNTNGYLFSETKHEIFPYTQRQDSASNYEKRQTELSLNINKNTDFSEYQRETLQQLLLDLMIIFPLNIYKFSIFDIEIKEFDPEPIQILESINVSKQKSSIFDMIYKKTNNIQNSSGKEFQYISANDIIELIKKRKSDASKEDILKLFSRSFIVGVFVDGNKNIPIIMTQNGEFTDGTYIIGGFFTSTSISKFWPTFETIRVPYSDVLTSDNVQPLNKTIVVYKFVKLTDASLYVKYNYDNRPIKTQLSGGFIESVMKDLSKKTGGTRKKILIHKKNYTVSIRKQKK